MSISSKLFPLNSKFSVGDKYLFRAKGYKNGGTVNLALRANYSDGKSPTYVEI